MAPWKKSLTRVALRSFNPKTAVIFTLHRAGCTLPSRLDLLTREQTFIVGSLMPGYSDSWVVTSKGILFLKMESGPVIKFHDFATGKETTISDFNGDLPPVDLSGFSISPNERTLFVYVRTLYQQIFKQSISQSQWSIRATSYQAISEGVLSNYLGRIFITLCGVLFASRRRLAKVCMRPLSERGCGVAEDVRREEIDFRNTRELAGTERWHYFRVVNEPGVATLIKSHLRFPLELAAWAALLAPTGFTVCMCGVECAAELSRGLSFRPLKLTIEVGEIPIADVVCNQRDRLFGIDQ
jgi:hypothetical protein